MTLENQALHLRIAELEAQLAERAAEVERANADAAHTQEYIERQHELYRKLLEGAERLKAERDAAKSTIAMLRRILYGTTALNEVEIEALEESKTADATTAIDLANLKESQRAGARVNSQLRAQLAEARAEVERVRSELQSACKAIDDRGICERDVTAPLSERLDAIIVDLRSDRHRAEMDAVELRAEVVRLQATLAAKPVDESQAVTIRYTNWRGETGDRRIVPLAIRYAGTEWHPEPQWLVDAWDVDKGAMRSFAAKDIHEWGLDQPGEVEL